MRRGAPRKSKSPWASSETARGHEPVAELGRLAGFSAILAATSGQAPSVVQLRAQDLLSEAAMSVVVRALEVHREDIERGALLSIDEGGTRVRMLPLRASRTEP